MLAVLCLCFAGCDDGTGTGGYTPFTGPTSIDEVIEYLADQTDGTLPDNPVELAVMVDASEWPQLFEAIAHADKWIALDLSRCYNVPLVFSLVLSPMASVGWNKTVSLVLPQGITTIGNYAFYGCGNLAYIDLPASLTTIGGFAFDGCINLRHIDLPAGITSIGYMAFVGCTMTQITLPARLTSIGGFAFGFCTNLTQITLSSGLQNIGDRAFDRCTSLTQITCYAVTPPALDSSGYIIDADDDTDLNLTAIRVPAGSVAAYKSAWSRYADIISAM